MPRGDHDRPRLPVPDDRAGWIEVSIRSPSVETTVLDLVALGQGVEALEPVELRDELHRAAARIATADDGPPPITRR